ncbi:hypothetical protein AB0E62_13050 [Streptomyces sp. NPDC038707]|uniref:hypothetical protein n=1 Tax=Streptomyces sp. NPDC038707 TaxID=3154329 RepID=UPI0033FFDE89
MGLVHEFTGRRVGLVRRSFLDGYEVYASVALVVPALALFAAADSRKRPWVNPRENHRTYRETLGD